MTKRSIKIIKRDAEAIVPVTLSAEDILMQQQKDEADGQRDMTKAVKTWIIERRENSKAEEIFSASRLFALDVDRSAEPAR